MRSTARRLADRRVRDSDLVSDGSAVGERVDRAGHDEGHKRHVQQVGMVLPVDGGARFDPHRDARPPARRNSGQQMVEVDARVRRRREGPVLGLNGQRERGLPCVVQIGVPVALELRTAAPAGLRALGAHRVAVVADGVLCHRQWRGVAADQAGSESGALCVPSARREGVGAAARHGDAVPRRGRHRDDGRRLLHHLHDHAVLSVAPWVGAGDVKPNADVRD